MKAAVFKGPGRGVTIETLADPEPGPGEVLIEVCRCGICGSDVTMTEEGAPFTFAAGPLGHEFSGTIVEVGAGVDARRRGQRVSCFAGSPCGRCASCNSGMSIVFCEAPVRSSAWSGGFGQFAVVPERQARPLPDSLSFADGALVEPMACGLHAFRMAGLAGGETVLVLGAGSMALSAVFWARRLGAGRLVVASRSGHRRDVAHDFGADAFHSFTEDEPDALGRLLGGAADIVVECVGREGMIGEAAKFVRPRGQIVSLGMCQRTDHFVPAIHNFRETTLRFPLAYSQDEYDEAARVFDESGFHPERMVGDVIALDRLPDTLEAMRAGTFQSLKVHVDPQMSQK